MSGRRFMEAMGEVEDKYIEEALQYVPAKSMVRGTWMKWCVTAACLALIVCAGIFATRSGKETPFELDPSLPMLRIESGEGGMGYSAVMYYDISEDSDLNPWNEEVVLETLPVYENLAYVEEVGGLPIYLSEEEMKALAEDVAARLGEEITEIELERLKDCTDAPEGFTGEEACSYTVYTQNAGINVEGNGQIRVNFLQEVALPEGFEETEDNVMKLAEEYANLVQLPNPVVDVYGDYTFSGEQYKDSVAYDCDEDILQSILNYNFELVKFNLSLDGKALSSIVMQNAMASSKKLGDYPAITVKEARKALLAGEYVTNVWEEDLPEGGIHKKDIAKVELVYHVSNICQKYLPYYCFYILMPEREGVTMTEGLKSYALVYVPAIRREYLENYPGEIPFN